MRGEREGEERRGKEGNEIQLVRRGEKRWEGETRDGKGRALNIISHSTPDLITSTLTVCCRIFLLSDRDFLSGSLLLGAVRQTAAGVGEGV